MIRIIDAVGQIYLETEYGASRGLLSFNRVVRQRQGGGEYRFEYEDIDQVFDFDFPDEQRPANQTILVERNGQPVRHIYNKFGNLLGHPCNMFKAVFKFSILLQPVFCAYAALFTELFRFKKMLDI